MKEPKFGTTSYPRPFGVGFLNPRLNRQYVEMSPEQMEEFAAHLGQLMESPDPDEELSGTWHIEKRIGFVNLKEND